MILIVLGLFIWSLVHMIPVLAPTFRGQLIAKMGELPYKGVFSLAIIASVALMVLGWRSIEAVTPLYDIYDIAILPGLLLLIIAFILMVASNIKSNFSRLVRHPQLLGFTIWAVVHMALNGDLRAVVLFGGLALWSVLTMVLSNRRDGAFAIPAKQLPHKGAIVVAIGFTLFIGAVMGHEYIAGVDLTTPR